MTRNSVYVGLAVALLFMTACASAPAPPAEPAPASAPAPASEPAAAPPADVSGTWSGDWGPSPSDRNPVTVELTFTGGTLTGVVNPGASAVTLSKAAYDPATGAVTMEAEAQGRGGVMVHYVIEGKAAGNTMSGSWSHDDVKGDFKISK